MLTNDVLTDGFNRTKQAVHAAVEGLSDEQLAFRPAEQANSIAWLVWHLSRIQDDHIATAAAADQVWKASDWHKKFALPFDLTATGYGHSSDEVASVQADAALLLGYYDAVHDATTAYLATLKEANYSQVIDESWDPPVTLAVRLMSVLAEGLQHAGQAAYLRGLL